MHPPYDPRSELPATDPGVAVPPPLPPRRRWRFLQPILFLATCITLTLMGALMWNPETEEALRAAGGDRGALLLALARHGTAYAICVLAILGSHEMGHYFACRYYGIPATLPFFLPAPFLIGTLGAVIRIRGPIPHRRALFDIAAAGPIAGFLVAIPVLGYGLLHAEPFLASPEGSGEVWIFDNPALMDLLRGWLGIQGTITMNPWIGAGWVGMLVTSMNLFPIGQLDGGHAAYSLSRGLHRRLSFATLVGLLALVVYQAVTLRQFPVYMLWFAILLWMRDRHPRLLDEQERLGPGRQLVALLLLAIFVLSFMALPFRIIEL